VGIPRLFLVAPRTIDIATSQTEEKSIASRPKALALDRMESFDHRIGTMVYANRFHRISIIENMDIPLNFAKYTQWSGIATLVFLVLTIIAFLVGWGIRFRLVGVTSFMAVLTVGIFGLGLGLFTRTEIPGAVRFSLVYDNGANQAVISLPNTVTPEQVEATLKQAASDLFSSGRAGAGGNNQFIISARTLVHPQPGLSSPLYLGQIKKSFSAPGDNTPELQLFPESFAKISQ
jgi:hypothetical protein